MLAYSACCRRIWIANSVARCCCCRDICWYIAICCCCANKCCCCSFSCGDVVRGCLCESVFGSAQSLSAAETFDVPEVSSSSLATSTAFFASSTAFCAARGYGPGRPRPVSSLCLSMILVRETFHASATLIMLSMAPCWTLGRHSFGMVV